MCNGSYRDTINNEDGHATGLMFIGILMFYIPVTFLISSIGIVLGIIGLKNIPERKILSIIGITLNTVIFGIGIWFIKNK